MLRITYKSRLVITVCCKSSAHLVHRRTSEWEDVGDSCCLLEVLPSSLLSRIQPDVLSSCTCSATTDGFEDYVDARNSLCKSDIGEDEFNRNMRSVEEVRSKQIEAALNTINTLNSGRTKRATPDETCAAASIGGADVVTTADVNGMDNATVLGCIAELTSREMEPSMARTVFAKILLAKNNQLDMLTVSELRNLQWAWAGIRAVEVKNLTTLAYTTFNDVVAEMGKDWNLNQDVVSNLDALQMSDVPV
ncbi:hypothetical protein SK128_022415 [Halocaridina rubra]|uniref:Uncharacterized protein n=1 Tax=Halocaridina rubra TaxID=373956 RepID=A0AAN8WYZ3_HALRR